MPSLGQKLRQERERRGWTVEELSAQTRINIQYFQAIEADDTSALPGGFFYRSFVRQYARLLELPESDYQFVLDQSLADDTAQNAGKQTALPERDIDVPPIPTGRFDAAVEVRRWAWRVGMLVVVIAMCSGVYTFWLRWRVQHEEQQAAAAMAQPAPTVVNAEKKQEPKPVPPPPTAPAPAPVEASVLPPQEAPTDGAVRLVIRATEMTWVAVWQGDKQLFADVIRAGETRGFGAPSRLRIRLGNAGGVEMEWNGQTVQPVGPRGQVRTVEFRPDGYSVIQPAPPPEQKPDGQV